MAKVVEEDAAVVGTGVKIVGSAEGETEGTIQLEPANPLQNGMRSDISDELKHTFERVNPIRWPNLARDNDQDKQSAPI
jgi:hypothetical protein